MKLVTFNTAIELICFLAALVFLLKDKSAAWRLFIVYLFFTFLVETTGLYMRKHGISNMELYNGFLLVECSFISYFFFNLYKVYQYKLKWLVGWLVAFLAMYLTELAYYDFDFDNFTSVTATIMSVFFVLVCLYYYYRKLEDESYEPLVSSASFWWVSGALFFYFGSTACNLFFDYLSTHEPGHYDRSVRYLIFNILNVIMYSFWTFSFICRYRQRKSSH